MSTQGSTEGSYDSVEARRRRQESRPRYSISFAGVKRIEQLTANFKLEILDCRTIMKKLASEIERGLGKRTQAKADVKCWPTYVQRLPHESVMLSHYLTLDVGGTNFRILLVMLRGSGEPHTQHAQYRISEALMTGPGTALFDHIALCTWRFIKGYTLARNHYKLGFTFSFPLRQVGLKKAYLTNWTKGFSCPGVEGRDVVHLLEQALIRTKIQPEKNVAIVAILNDTTATLMNCAREFRCTRVGVINGTGTNACYVESVARAETFVHSEETASFNSDKVLINTEWGAFGDNGTLNHFRTKYDREVDKHSINPGRQTFEKMISGMYLGEIVRLVMLDAVQERMLCGGVVTEQLRTRNVIDASFLSDCEQGDATYTDTAEEALRKKLGYPHPSKEDCNVVRRLCQRVSNRSARLLAAGLAVLLERIPDRKELQTMAIGSDGSMFRHHPTFNQVVLIRMKELLGNQVRFTIEQSVDGSAVGAAITCACHSVADENQEFKKVAREEGPYYDCTTS